MLLVFLFLLIFSSPAFADSVKDLGTFGFVCGEQDVKTDIFDSRANSPILQTKVNEINFGFKPKLEINLELGLKTINILGVQDRKIFVFGADDSNSKDAAKSIKADYGICIRYDSVNDIDTFRGETGIKFPVQLGNDEIIRFLKIDSYPALISIEGSKEKFENKN